ncbi:ABC transporter ATP-binding protein [Tardisphaera saccharovorans]
MPIIEAKRLRKRYGSFEALKGIDFEVQEGKVVALVGPNGAGKTTTLKILSGFLRPTEGKVSIMGKDPWSHPELKKDVAYILDRPNFPPHVKVKDFLKEAALMVGEAPDVGEEYLKALGLQEYAQRSFSKLSAGNMQKFAIAVALLRRPKLVVADEPSSNLDPGARAQLYDLIIKLRKENGTTFFISSHVLTEMEKVADEVIIMAEGQIKAQAPLGQLASSLSGSSFRITTDKPELLAEALKGQVVEGKVMIGEQSASLSTIDEAAKRVGAKIISVERVGSSLDEIFKKLVGEE